LRVFKNNMLYFKHNDRDQMESFYFKESLIFIDSYYEDHKYISYIYHNDLQIILIIVY